MAPIAKQGMITNRDKKIVVGPYARKIRSKTTDRTQAIVCRESGRVPGDPGKSSLVPHIQSGTHTAHDATTSGGRSHFLLSLVRKSG